MNELSDIYCYYYSCGCGCGALDTQDFNLEIKHKKGLVCLCVVGAYRLPDDQIPFT